MNALTNDDDVSEDVFAGYVGTVPPVIVELSLALCCC